MHNDCLFVIYKTKLVDKKGSKIDDVMGFWPNHVFSSNNGRIK